MPYGLLFLRVFTGQTHTHKCRVPKAELFHALWAALPEGARKKAEGAAQSGTDTEAQAAQAASGDVVSVLVCMHFCVCTCDTFCRS